MTTLAVVVATCKIDRVSETRSIHYRCLDYIEYSHFYVYL